VNKAINADCPHCGKVYTVSENTVGKKATCKVCRRLFVIQLKAKKAKPPKKENLPVGVTLENCELCLKKTRHLNHTCLDCGLTDEEIDGSDPGLGTSKRMLVLCVYGILAIGIYLSFPEIQSSPKNQEDVPQVKSLPPANTLPQQRRISEEKAELMPKTITHNSSTGIDSKKQSGREFPDRAVLIKGRFSWKPEPFLFVGTHVVAIKNTNDSVIFVEKVKDELVLHPLDPIGVLGKFDLKFFSLSTDVQKPSSIQAGHVDLAVYKKKPLAVHALSKERTVVLQHNGKDYFVPSDPKAQSESRGFLIDSGEEKIIGLLNGKCPEGIKVLPMDFVSIEEEGNWQGERAFSSVFGMVGESSPKVIKAAESSPKVIKAAEKRQERYFDQPVLSYAVDGENILILFEDQSRLEYWTSKGEQKVYWNAPVPIQRVELFQGIAILFHAHEEKISFRDMEKERSLGSVSYPGKNLRVQNFYRRGHYFWTRPFRLSRIYLPDAIANKKFEWEIFEHSNHYLRDGKWFQAISDIPHNEGLVGGDLSDPELGYSVSKGVLSYETRMDKKHGRIDLPSEMVSQIKWNEDRNLILGLNKNSSRMTTLRVDPPSDLPDRDARFYHRDMLFPGESVKLELPVFLSKLQWTHGQEFWKPLMEKQMECSFSMLRDHSHTQFVYKDEDFNLVRMKLYHFLPLKFRCQAFSEMPYRFFIDPNGETEGWIMKGQRLQVKRPSSIEVNGASEAIFMDKYLVTFGKELKVYVREDGELLFEESIERESSMMQYGNRVIVFEKIMNKGLAWGEIEDGKKVKVKWKLIPSTKDTYRYRWLPRIDGVNLGNSSAFFSKSYGSNAELWSFDVAKRFSRFKIFGKGDFRNCWVGLNKQFLKQENGKIHVYQYDPRKGLEKVHEIEVGFNFRNEALIAIDAEHYLYARSLKPKRCQVVRMNAKTLSEKVLADFNFGKSLNRLYVAHDKAFLQSDQSLMEIPLKP
jgi:hypothetical protein